MTIEEQVIAVLRDLPENRRGEVLDFAAFLKQRSTHSTGLRPYGLCSGQLQVPDDFNAPLPQHELGLFE